VSGFSFVGQAILPAAGFPAGAFGDEEIVAARAKKQEFGGTGFSL